jgi:hypothetical protein
MRKLIKSILPEDGVGDLKIRPRGDNRCESAKCQDSVESRLFPTCSSCSTLRILLYFYASYFTFIQNNRCLLIAVSSSSSILSCLRSWSASTQKTVYLETPSRPLAPMYLLISSIELILEGTQGAFSGANNPSLSNRVATLRGQV